MSYAIQDQYAIDLTRVDSRPDANSNHGPNPSANANSATTFEVEVELLVDTARQSADDMAECLVTAIRSLLSIANK